MNGTVQVIDEATHLMHLQKVLSILTFLHVCITRDDKVEECNNIRGISSDDLPS